MAFRPERLAVHELLIRVTADVSVPDGPNYEDLGINFREITETILTDPTSSRTWPRSCGPTTICGTRAAA